ncbi:glucans biosynthesis glucosyltransferase MdoH [Belnapia sp. F-4-1]|uniref:glucans biosynthesis glucosyltransferase MdoH n=1 Tax=Belnapia sp. F-4-1 TaxID=1545443 RepID=UPI00118596CA|nr:glucans biosynthesis glucosyltransferase MdoH [Belnapia sp. F-4-1]
MGAAHGGPGSAAPLELSAATLAGERHALRPRRRLMAALVAGLAAGLVALGWHVLAAGGWTVWEALILACLAVNAPWLGLAAATGLAGITTRLRARDPLAAVLPALRQPGWGETAITARTVLAVCVRLEDMAAVLPPLGALLAELRRPPAESGCFRLAILSDTPDGAAAQAEAEAVARLAARFPPGAVHYRRRACNTGYKAGNLMDFLDHDAAGEFLLLLDADSAMSAAAVRRLVRLMQADRRLAILQPTIQGHGAATRFAHAFGLGQRHGMRIWATGQAWWQGPEGAFWGHNALIRIAPFRAHARLPLLPGGEAILSHDLVEAALLHAAGWAVRVLPDDAGSFERHPPDLLACLDRDIRWARGNLQFRHLLRRPDLGRLGRLQMVQAILHYVLTPFWFALLPLAALNAATGGGEGTPRAGLLLLLAAGFVMLNLPKLAGHAEALLHPGPRIRRLGPILREVATALAADAIMAAERTALILTSAIRPSAGWASQQRDGRRLRPAATAWRLRASMATGLASLALLAAAGPFPVLVAAPVWLPLLLAMPIVVRMAEAPPPPEPPR